MTDRENYELCYVSDNGAEVWVHQLHTGPERDDNEAIARLLADAGEIVMLLPVGDTPGVKNPDAWIGGQVWKFKTNHAATGTSIDTEIKRAAKQANDILIRLTRPMAIDDLANALFGRVRQCEQVERLAVILDNKLYLFDRASIMNQAFRRQLKKEKGA